MELIEDDNYGQSKILSKPTKKKRKNPFTATDQKEKDDIRKLRRGRVIIRNISYKATVESLREYFSQFGTISDVNLLKRPDGKLVGCAFIQFERVNDAAKAILKATNKEFLKRPVYVDWAVGKDVYKKKSETEPKEEVKTENDVNMDDTLEDVKDEDDSSDDDNEIKSEENTDDDDIKTENDSDNEKGEDISGDDEKPGMDMEDVEENPKPKRKSNDVKEGLTIFIKNVCFDATDDDVRKCCRKFGPIYYAIINRDGISGHSKGTAFVKFKTKESADLCLKAGEEFVLMDQVMEPHPALSREDIRERVDSVKQKDRTDSRNLYLAKEGLIMSGSKAAEGVSAADMTKRHKLEQIKTQILKNLNRFVSRNRLSIHNLPIIFDDNKLKDILIKHTNFIPHECRVMRENRPSAGHPQGKSKGFGFMSFKTHLEALAALRKLNNNPDIFGAAKRPIVAFSIEDKSVHNIKENRLRKSRDNNPTYKEKLEKLKEKKRNKKQKNKDDKSRTQTAINNQNQGNANKNKKSTNVGGPDKNLDDYVGMPAKPGSFIRMRSNWKITEQSKQHTKKLSEIKRNQKRRKEKMMHRLEKKAIDRPKMGKKKPEKDNFSFLVDKYKRLIDTKAEPDSKKGKRQKWYVE